MLLESLGEHVREWWWLFPLSLFVFVASAAAVFVIIVRLPADYFRSERRAREYASRSHPLVRIPFHVLKQGLGIVLIGTGIIMLVTPGQGLLTILIGITLLDFKGKYELERRLVARAPVRAAINWLRRKAGQAPLEF